ncbi:MAG: ABC transporter permease [Nitrososphaerota archaeon]|jgi:ABC-2 type transport system permease protein|nr:ABC transporter permease [Nitrososphaerota archaeon]MDG6912948.1 ABC transporter permease [Nitrososphaerota archaeon]MDG6937286.1 ABC transporter permease [Nitrososphaerota archaeon]MDG6961354.1 ABC transporter permease [Nitrososphaerota archaeon]MDG6962828.1 ABC transporter permease [Nitrososphaerota archaeon]
MSDESKSVVGSLAHVGITAKYNFLNYFRARRFYVMLAIIVIITGLLTTLVGYYRPPSFVGGDALGFYGAGWGSFASFVVVLSAAFFGGDAISGEFQNRTGYFLVPNPIRRSAIYVGKWLAALAASTIILGVFALAMLANGLFYFPGSIPWEFVESFAFAWVYLVAAMSLAFAFSSLFKSSSISILMSVILLLFVFNVIDTVASLVAGIEPWFSITYAAGIISDVLNVPYPAHKVVTSLGAGRRFTLAQFHATIPEGLLILGVYFVVMAVLGLVLFERKEFTS